MSKEFFQGRSPADPGLDLDMQESRPAVAFWCGFYTGLISMVLAIAAVGLLARAQAESWAVLSLVSYHVQRGHHNEFNYGVGLEQEVSQNWRRAVGVYRNSNWKTSAYVTRAWVPLQVSNWRAGVFGGGVTGYEKPLMPFGGLVASYEGRQYGVNLVAVPEGGGVLFAQWKMRW